MFAASLSGGKESGEAENQHELCLLSQVDAALPPQHDMLDVEESGGSLEGVRRRRGSRCDFCFGVSRARLGFRLALRNVAALNESTKS